MPTGTDTGYAIGHQEMEVRFLDGTAELFACRYPPEGETSHSIAERKLRDASDGLVDADEILGLVMSLEDEPDVRRLSGALSSGRRR
jgi:hypothetical protein